MKRTYLQINLIRRVAAVLAIAFAGLYVHTSISAAECPDPLPIPNSDAASEAEMKPYVELVEHANAKIDMVPITSGKFTMGSPETEADRREDEGPQREVAIDAFWMGKYEITWDAYEVWMSDLDIFRRTAFNIAPNARRRVSTEPTDGTLHRHELRHGDTRLSGDLHDATCGPHLLQVADCQDRTLLPLADRS